MFIPEIQINCSVYRDLDELHSDELVYSARFQNIKTLKQAIHTFRKYIIEDLIVDLQEYELAFTYSITDRRGRTVLEYEFEYETQNEAFKYIQDFQFCEFCDELHEIDMYGQFCSNQCQLDHQEEDSFMRSGAADL